MYLWPYAFQNFLHTSGSVKENQHLLLSLLLTSNEFISDIIEKVRGQTHDQVYLKRYPLNSQWHLHNQILLCFSEWRRMRYQVTYTILKGDCPRKINLFNWLARKNCILTMDNLAIRRCNRLPTKTCIMSHADIESINHLIMNCSFAVKIWEYFGQLFNIVHLPTFLSEVWGP